MSAEAGRGARFREAAGALVQYALLFGFAAVAAAISAQGLVGFARSDMRLAGPWPYLLWGALDGAAGLCAVLLMRRAARGESAVAPRLAVWGLVAASSVFNWAHAPDRPGARAAFALMPVIAAVLFEFSLRETRHTARRAERRLAGLGWLRPAERVRVQFRLSADPDLSAQDAARQVRIEVAARRLHGLRLALAARERAGRARLGSAWRVRRVERRAQAALARARFADPGFAAEVLRHVQVLTLTTALAELDYTSADDSRTLLASLIATDGSRSSQGASAGQRQGQPEGSEANGRTALNGHARPLSVELPGCALPVGADGAPPSLPLAGSAWLRGADRGDAALVEAAARMVERAREDGAGLSQAELARRLRAQGFRIANERLRWLAAASGLGPEPEQP